MKLKKIALTMSISLFALPLLTYANDFKITNHTSQELSFSINQTCADTLTTVKANDTDILYETQLTDVCKNNLSDCELAVHNAAHCYGKKIALLSLDIHSGIKKITVLPQANYSFTGSGFYITVVEPIPSHSR